jgi:hypothetical protein
MHTFFSLNSPDKDIGVEVEDVDLIGPEQGAYQSSLGDLHLWQLKVSRTQACLVEDGKGSGLFLSLKLW